MSLFRFINDLLFLPKDISKQLLFSLLFCSFVYIEAKDI